MPGKMELRREMKSARAGLESTYRAFASEQIEETLLTAEPFVSAASWFVYVSFRNEVATHRLVDKLRSLRRNVFVPRTGDDGLMQAVAFPGWDSMQVERFGFLAPPAGARQATKLDVCICPGLAFTASGDRLGYGQGHYDRFLQQWPGLTTTGLAFRTQVVGSIPTEATDRPMDWLVTDRGLTCCSAKR